MRLFLGEYEHVLDDRGRITLPRKIRLELSGEEVILARGFDQCVFGFDTEQWEKEAEKHISGSLTDQQARGVRRFLFSAAEKADIDRIGRILVPAHLKEHGQITKTIVVVGAGDHFELWDKETWIKVKKTLQTP